MSNVFVKVQQTGILVSPGEAQIESTIMRKFDSFGMEQKLMDCWNICEDLDTLLEGVLDYGMSTDNISNVLLGLKDLYQVKFEQLWAHFESMVAENIAKKQEF